MSIRRLSIVTAVAAALAVLYPVTLRAQGTVQNPADRSIRARGHTRIESIVY